MSAPEDENELDRQQRLIYKYMPCKAGVWGWGRVNLKSEMRNLNKSELSPYTHKAHGQTKTEHQLITGQKN